MSVRVEYGDELMHHGVKGQRWGVRRYQRRVEAYRSASAKQRAMASNKMLDSTTRKTALTKAKAYEDIANRTEKYANADGKGVRKLGTEYTKSESRDIRKYSAEKGKYETNEKIKRAYEFMDNKPELVNSYYRDMERAVGIGTFIGGMPVGVAAGFINLHRYRKVYGLDLY